MMEAQESVLPKKEWGGRRNVGWESQTQKETLKDHPQSRLVQISHLQESVLASLS